MAVFCVFFLAVLGLRCCVRAFSSCDEQGLLFVVVRGLLITVASLVVEHGLQARRLQQLWNAGSVVVARGLQSAGSVVVAHRLSCSAACGIFPDQGSNPCPLLWERILNHCTTREAPQLLFSQQVLRKVLMSLQKLGYLIPLLASLVINSGVIAYLARLVCSFIQHFQS